MLETPELVRGLEFVSVRRDRHGEHFPAGPPRLAVRALVMTRGFDGGGRTPALRQKKSGTFVPGYHRAVSDPLSVVLHGFAHGGEAVGRMPDGRAVFVGYGIPGETVTVRVTEEHERWCRAQLVDVVEPSDDRVTPPCPYFGVNQCGGCKLQHIAPARQRALLRQVVIDQLERLGRIPDPPVAATMPAGDFEYRNRARFGVTPTGALGYRRSGSHELLVIDRCLLLDEPTQRLRERAGDAFPPGSNVEVRTGATGAAVVVDPGREQTLVIDEALTESVAGFDYQVSETSFFQANREGAAILLQLVRDGAALLPGDAALDLYAGVGLFAKALQADGAKVTAVEGSNSSVRDARRNLGPDAEVVKGPVHRVVRTLAKAGRTFDVVVLDPPREGAGKGVIETVGTLAGRTIVIVACDPAALGRDAGTLAGAGWQLQLATPVDQFAQTGHVEVVAVFARVTGG
jgi:tRNA/tmRNA/rRNA uracil-C5-methylase (TrmA/RlmC/RlmD family)